MVPVAHIAGIPVEETLGMFAPVAAVVFGAWLAMAKSRIAELTRRLRPPIRMKAPRAR
jgi:hypothetical protein